MGKQPTPPNDQPLAPTKDGRVEPWVEFRQKHPRWAGFRQDQSRPLYALSDDAIHALATSKNFDSGKTRRTPRPLINTENADAELAFAAACGNASTTTIGRWNDHWIGYPLLFKGTSTDSIAIPQELRDQWAKAGGVDSSQMDNQVQAAMEALIRLNAQLLGYVGKLMFDSQLEFRKERDELESLWQRAGKPRINQGSASLLAPPARRDELPADFSATAADKETARFFDELGKFYQKWNLSALVTWDLPLPQGPLTNVPASLATRLSGPDVMVDVYPSFFDIPKRQDVREEIRERQNRQGRAAGMNVEHPITDTSPRAGHGSQWETAFRMWFVEETIRHRYGSPHGLVACLSPVFEHRYSISTDQVKKLRKLYSRYLTN